MRRFVRDNSLSIVFGGLFAAALVGEALAGWAAFNGEQVAAGLDQVSLGSYVTSASFAADVAENWQSEYLQFLLYILGTVWLVQRGSPESKKPGKAGTESPRDQKIGPHATDESPRWARTGGARTTVFSWSLSPMMGSIFVASWLVQSVAGWASYNETRLQHCRTRCRGPATSPAPTSGPAPCRTGSRSSSRWDRWRCSASTCGSAARRRASRSGSRTPARASKAEAGAPPGMAPLPSLGRVA